MAKAGKQRGSKGKSRTNGTQKRSQRAETKDLSIPKLNTSGDPQGLIKKRRKVGKKFIEDSSVMMRILGQVNDKQEGNIKSKLQRAAELDKIREQKRAEQEAKESKKQAKMEAAKATIKANSSKKTRQEKSETSRKAAEKKAKAGGKVVAFA